MKDEARQDHRIGFIPHPSSFILRRNLPMSNAGTCCGCPLVRQGLSVLGTIALFGAVLAALLWHGPTDLGPKAAAAAADADARPGNWSHWRGPEQNGFSREKGLPDSFSTDPAAPKNLVWRAPVGGRTTPIVQKGRLYLITRTGNGKDTEQERVVCFDADNGKQLWEHKFNVYLTDIVSDRLGWTTMTGDPETDTVFAHGTQGDLYCFDRSGKIVWHHQLTEEYGRISGYGGRVTSPIVDGDLLIIGMLNASWGYLGAGRNRFVAFDKRTGNVVWWASTGNQPLDTYYSIPVVAVIGGERLLISGGGDGGVHAFKVRTGEKVWSYIFGSGMVNCSPVVDGTFVYIGQAESNLDNNLQGKVICLDGSKVKNGKPELVWQEDGLKAKFASPIIHGGRLYICNDFGRLWCLDAKTGKRLWFFQYGKNTKGSPVLADGKIYIGEVDSAFHILEPGEARCKRLHKEEFPAHEGAPVEINGSPAVVNGRVYFMTSAELYCIGLKDHSAKPDPSPIQPREGEKGKPAWLQVIPADVTLHPGESVEFKARTFDAGGQLIGEEKAIWSLGARQWPEGIPPPEGGAPKLPPLAGELSVQEGISTKLTVAKAPPSQFGKVIAKAGSLEGSARVRVAPTLPYAPDFTKVPDNGIPGGWVNCQGKFAMVTLPDKTKALKKLAVNPSPLVARAHTFIGTPDLTGYTIEADVMATQVNKELPDVGISANRYIFMLAGKGDLRLVSWDALPRIDHTIEYKWKPDTWYHLKVTTAKQGGKFVARGKVWLVGDKEPEKWSLEVTDPVPNENGSPTLYAYIPNINAPALGSEAFFKNVKITPN
jgi:outer membrane protein assembly factor BamB